MADSKLKFQWFQLSALSFAHLANDIFPGLFPVIMPAIQDKFNFSIAQGVILLSVLNITCNFVQIISSHFRQDKTSLFFVPIGLLLSGVLVFVATVPAFLSPFWYIASIAFIAGIGIAITHPEFLQAIHTIDRITPSMGSAVFMNGGYLGYVTGGYIASYLVVRMGLNGLYLLLAFPLIALVMIYASKIKLLHSQHNDSINDNHNIISLGFLGVFLISVPVTTAVTVLFALVPQQIKLLGYDLRFGGLSNLICGLGTICGTLLWAKLAHKKGELFASALALLIGTPILLVYLLFMHIKITILLLFVVGFTAGSVYPLVVTLARFAKGLKLGQRMGIIVGGSWGAASIILLLLGPVVEFFSVKAVLLVTPSLFIIAAAVAIYLKIKSEKAL